MKAIAGKGDLAKLGFVLNTNKSVWEPPLIQTWLGNVFNMSENRLYATETRLSKLKEPFHPSWPARTRLQPDA